MAADDEDRDEIDEDEEDDGEKGEEDDEDMDDRNDPFDPYSRAERERSRSSASLIIPSSPLLPIPDRPTVSQPRPPAAVANEVRTPNMRLEGTGGKGSGAKARRKMPTWVTATPVFG